jgi:hypothetical protein
LNPVITFAKGNQYFGVKPYQVLIIGYERSKEGAVLEFILYDDFEKKPDGSFKLNEEGRYRFNPGDVVLSNELKEELKKDGVSLPSYAFTSLAKPVILRRGVDSMESECPGFQRYWEQEVEECKACAKHFPDEYTICKKICLEKRESRAQGQSTSEGKQPDTTKALQEFKGFREGTRADVLIKFLESAKSCSFDEAAKHISKTLNINDRVALVNVKSYVWEWAKGRWNNQPQNFSFTLVIQGEVIKYSTK